MAPFPGKGRSPRRERDKVRSTPTKISRTLFKKKFQRSEPNDADEAQSETIPSAIANLPGPSSPITPKRSLEHPIGSDQDTFNSELSSDESVPTGRVIGKAIKSGLVFPEPIKLSEIPASTDNIQPEDVRQLTRWAWERAAAIKSNNIITLQAKLQPINVLRMREKARRGSFGPVVLNVNSRHHLEGAVMQIVGKEEAEPCVRCKTRNGPFLSCTSVADHQGGSCGNCVTGGNASKCSLREATSTHNTPRGTKRRLMADAKDTKKMKAADRNRVYASLTKKQVAVIAEGVGKVASQGFIDLVTQAGGPAESRSEEEESEQWDGVDESE